MTSVSALSLIAWLCLYIALTLPALAYLGKRAVKVARKQSTVRSIRNQIDPKGLVALACTALVGAIALIFISSTTEITFHIGLWAIMSLSILAAEFTFQTHPQTTYTRCCRRAAPFYVLAGFVLTALTAYPASERPVPLRENQTQLSSAATDQIPGEFPATTTNRAELKQHDCIRVDQVQGGPSLVKVACGDSSTFRVIQVVDKRSDCIADSDLVYVSATHNYAACLDYDWSVVRCLRISPGEPVRKVDCALAGAERVESIITPADDAKNCPHGGFAHHVRKFAVCTAATG